jgi:peptidoglycan hydrolase CwlO-like protein
MKSLKSVILLAFTVLLAVALLPACNKAPEMMTPTAVVDDISAQKDQYVKDFQAKVDEYQVKIDELKTKAETASGTVKDELNQKIDMLTAKQEEAKSKIEEIKAATVDTWDNVKAGADQVLTEIDNLYNDALSLIK